MKLTDLFLTELHCEADRTRRLLEHVPAGHSAWQPYESSMSLGYLSSLVASLPGHIATIIGRDEDDIGERSNSFPSLLRTSRELVQKLDQSVERAHEALRGANDEHLSCSWRLLDGGRIIGEYPRHFAIRETVFSRLSHYRGQLTVYLRLNDVYVPGIYGASADESRLFRRPSRPERSILGVFV